MRPVPVPGRKGVVAIGDVHGCLEELRTLLDGLRSESARPLVLIGDYIDRGPWSRAALELVMELVSRGDTFALLGNHEASLLEFLDAPASPEAVRFLLNGGGSTLQSYSDVPGSFRVPPDHVAFLRSLPLVCETEDHYFVHAGLPQLPVELMDAGVHREDLLWIREQFLEASYDWGKVVVHGHTPRMEVEVTPRRIDIDTGCVFQNKLTALLLPERSCVEVRRYAPMPSSVFRDSPESRRKAVRFDGVTRVAVFRDREIFAFRTANYSEMGALLECVDGSSRARFALGETMRGEIVTDDRHRFAFEGQVVRVEAGDKGERYGVQFFAPPEVNRRPAR
jgi:serine/threonine protein phosphatase 1